MRREAREVREVDADYRGDVRSLAGLNFILGIWLIISPWVLSYATGQARWNQVIFGIVVLVLSFIRYVAPRANSASWFNGLAGIWLIIAPFVLNYSKTVTFWNEIIVGIVVAILAFSNLGTYTHPRRHHHTTA